VLFCVENGTFLHELLNHFTRAFFYGRQVSGVGIKAGFGCKMNELEHERDYIETEV
jgi:hypothetical protein